MTDVQMEKAAHMKRKKKTHLHRVANSPYAKNLGGWCLKIKEIPYEEEEENILLLEVTQ